MWEGAWLRTHRPRPPDHSAHGRPSSCRRCWPAQGGHSGAPVKLFVHVKDSRGKRLKEGGEDVVVRVSTLGAGHLPVDVADNEDGTYTATYTPPSKGNYQVTVEVNGIPIAGSPFPVFFSAPLDPAALAAEQAAEAAAASAAAQAQQDGAAAAAAAQPAPGDAAAGAAALGGAGGSSIVSLAAQAGMSALAGMSADEHLRTLYLGNISRAVPNAGETLRQLFGVFGHIADLKLMERQDMGVLVFSAVDAQKDAQQLNLTMFGDRPLYVTAPLSAMQAGVVPANPPLAMQMQQIMQMQVSGGAQEGWGARVADLVWTGPASSRGARSGAGRVHNVTCLPACHAPPLPCRRR